MPAAASLLASTRTVPEHSPSPTPVRAVRGFVGCLLARAALLLYAAWVLLPEEFLHSRLGITFLPQRYWAVAVPIYAATVFAALVLVGYPSLGLCLTPPLDDVRNVVDEHTVFLGDDDEEEEEEDVDGAGGDRQRLRRRRRRTPLQVGDVNLARQLRTIYAK